MRKATKSLNFKMTSIVTKDVSGECIIEGYANTSTKDRVGDVVLPSAFEKTLKTYLSNPVMLLNHDWNDVIGRCISAEITDKGLFIRARISDTRMDIKTLIAEKCYSTMSIGYNELDADYDESTKTKYIKELELLEISVVSVPANTEAMFTQITEKTDTEETEKKTDEEKKAKKAGALKSFISEVKTVIGKGFDDEALYAVIEYFNSQEETMTKDELIKLLNTKTLPEQKQEEAKPEMQGDDIMKTLAAKLDALAQAVVQVMEKLEQMGKPASEEQPKEEPAKEEMPKEEAKEEPAKEEPSKEDEAKEGEEEKECDGEHMEDEEEKDFSIEQIDKDLAELNAQIDALDEEVNG
jgi:HK97 family phage prohead protease